MLSLKKTKTELPSQFTFPFEYTPHSLVVEAADEVKCFLRETGLDYPGSFSSEIAVSASAKTPICSKVSGSVISVTVFMS